VADTTSDCQAPPLYVTGQSWLGGFAAAATPRGLRALLLADEAAVASSELLRRYPECLPASDPVWAAALLVQAVDWLDPLNRTPAPALDVRGTPFQQRVWQALLGVRPGRMVSYRELAEMIGQPTAVRAVAGACAANPIAVVIPCHRVCRSDGALGGYRWGLWRKCCLLGRESTLAGVAHARAKVSTPSAEASSSMSAGLQANSPQVTTPTN
jgi:AraC family transcriptional regulator, regulatory protein of adaptative response / methylated-DNA-[protein]-cysteine methyltransferase